MVDPASLGEMRRDRPAFSGRGKPPHPPPPRPRRLSPPGSERRSVAAAERKPPAIFVLADPLRTATGGAARDPAKGDRGRTLPEARRRGGPRQRPVSYTHLTL